MNSNFSVESILNGGRKLSPSNTSDPNLLVKSTNDNSTNLLHTQTLEPNNILSNLNFNSHLFNYQPNLNIQNFNQDLNQFSSNKLIQYENSNQQSFKKFRSNDLNSINQFNELPISLYPINHNLNISSFEKKQHTIRNDSFSTELDNRMSSFYLSATSDGIQDTFLPFKSNESSFVNSNQNTQVKNKDKSSCSRCKLHGQYSELKNHKNNCPFLNCSCDVCKLYKNTNKLRRKNADNNFDNNLPNFFNFESNNESPSTFNFVESTSTNLINEHQRNVLPTNNESNKSIPANDYSNGFEEKLENFNNSILENNTKQVIEILKEKLVKDGLNFEKELPKLKFAVIGMLLQKFEDKNELFYKLSRQ